MKEDRTWCTWISFVRDALSCLDNDYQWIHLPNAGGYYDQDEWTFSIWQSVRVEYIEARRDETFMKTLRAQHGKG